MNLKAYPIGWQMLEEELWLSLRLISRKRRVGQTGSESSPFLVVETVNVNSQLFYAPIAV